MGFRLPARLFLFFSNLAPIEKRAFGASQSRPVFDVYILPAHVKCVWHVVSSGSGPFMAACLGA